MWKEIKNIKSGKKELKEFGITVGVILGLLGTLFLWRERSFYHYFDLVSMVLSLCGLFLPLVLKPAHKIWMSFALIIGFIMTRVILSVLFYFVITPLAIVIKLFGKDTLDLKINKSQGSYWKKKEKKGLGRLDYEKQF